MAFFKKKTENVQTHRQAAHQAENAALQQENRSVGGGNGRQLVAADKAHHEGVHHGQTGGDQILQNHGDAEQDQIFVKGLALIETGKHGINLS